MTCFEIMCFILKTYLPFILKECWYLCDMSSYIQFCRNMYNILQYYLSKLHSSKSFSDIFDQRRILSMSTLFWSIQACKAILYAERELINLYIFHYKLLSWYACVAHLPFFILFLLVSQCSDIFLLTIRTFFFLSSIVFLYCNLLNLFQNSLSCPIFNNKLSICIRIHTSVNENTKRRASSASWYCTMIQTVQGVPVYRMCYPKLWQLKWSLANICIDYDANIDTLRNVNN